MLSRLHSIADHGDLADESFTARALEVAFRQQHHRFEQTGVNRLEFLFEGCPFSSAITKCEYSIAQRDNDTRLRGRLTLTLDPAKLCVSTAAVTKVFGPGGKTSVPLEMDPLWAIRDRPPAPGKPPSGPHGVRFEFLRGDDKKLAVSFQFRRQSCLQEVTIWQDQR